MYYHLITINHHQRHIAPHALGLVPSIRVNVNSHKSSQRNPKFKPDSSSATGLTQTNQQNKQKHSKADAKCRNTERHKVVSACRDRENTFRSSTVAEHLQKSSAKLRGVAGVFHRPSTWEPLSRCRAVGVGVWVEFIVGHGGCIGSHVCDGVWHAP